MITLPATETAIPSHVSACQRNDSNVAEITSATMGTVGLSRERCFGVFG